MLYIMHFTNLVTGQTMLEAKNRVFEFDYHKINMFESVQCSKKQCSSLFNKPFSISIEGSKFDV